MVSIPTLPRLSQLGNFVLANSSLQGAFCATSISEAVVREAQNLSSFFARCIPATKRQQIRNYLIYRFDQIQSISNKGNQLMLAGSCFKLVYEINKQYGVAANFMALAYSHPLALVMTCWVTVMAGIVIQPKISPALYRSTSSVVTFFNRGFSPLMNLNALLPQTEEMQNLLRTNQLSIHWYRTPEQLAEQRFLVARIVVSFALAYFSASRIPIIIDIAAQMYSFVKLAKLRYLEIQQTRLISNPEDSAFMPSQDRIHYRQLHQLSHSLDETCASCGENQPARPTIDFCENGHVLHTACLANHLYENISNFVSYSVRNYSEYLQPNIRYYATMPEVAAPVCPTCNTLPRSQEYAMQLHLQNGEWVDVNPEIPDSLRQPVAPPQDPPESLAWVEKADFIYSLFDTYLLCSEPYRSAFATFFLNLVSGALAIALYCKINDKVKEKYYPNERLVPFAFGVAYMVGIAGIAAISFFGTAYLRSFFKPLADLKNILSTMGLSQDELIRTNVSWGEPSRAHTIGERLLVSRVILNLVLACFARNPLLNLTNAALQSVGLYKLFNVIWINYATKFNNPLQQFSFRLLEDPPAWKDKYAKALERITLSSNYIIDSSIKNDPAALKASLQTMREVTNNALVDSAWDRYWLITKENGRELYRTLQYKISLRQGALSAVKGDRFPFLDVLSANDGFDKFEWRSPEFTIYS